MAETGEQQDNRNVVLFCSLFYGLSGKEEKNGSENIRYAGE